MRLRFSQAVRAYKKKKVKSFWWKFFTNWLLEKQIWNDLWTVKKSFQWIIDYDTKSYTIIVPIWFETDLGSIPKPLWIFFDKTKYVWFILHDYMISQVGKHIFSDKWVKTITRKIADEILIEAMNYEWASSIEKFFIYIWVRIGSLFKFKRKWNQ